MPTLRLVHGERNRSSLLLMAGLLCWVSACGLLDRGAGGAGAGPSGAAEKTPATTSELSAAQCDYFETAGKVTICHATGSATNPYVLLKLSEAACIDAHRDHARDFVDVDGGDCNHAACLPQAAPCDATLPCCGSSSCVGGSCQCPSGQTFCGATCVDTSRDANNCGGCGHTCPGGSLCGAGVCGSPSCQVSASGTTDCGAGGENCCSSPEVPAGTFFRTYANYGGGASGQADAASVSRFRLDKYLVTVGRFRQYVSYVTSGTGARPANGSGVHQHLNGGLGLVSSAYVGGAATTLGYEAGWDSASWDQYIPTGPSAAAAWNARLGCAPGFDTWTPAVGAHESLPITCVNWYEAYAFCIWDGGFLPSEAEWEYAAAGGSEQRQYPWGSASPGIGNQYAIYGCNYPGGSGICTGTASLAPVGTASLGAARWGQLDMAGNAQEWNLDWYATYVNPCQDCAYLTMPGGSAGRDLMGGAFADDNNIDPNASPSRLFPSTRNYVEPIQHNPGFGFRCARTP